MSRRRWISSSAGITADAVIALPDAVIPVLTIVAMKQSDEADNLRIQLESVRNIHLETIARNTQRPITQGEKNAAVLRRHLNAQIVVHQNDMSWASTPEIVEVNSDDVVTLFTPRSATSSTAYAVKVRSADLEIDETPRGSCPLTLILTKIYGMRIPLGEITKWEDRLQSGQDHFVKGSIAQQASFAKGGSPETRHITVFASNDGTNLFRLEASTGTTATGDNQEISKRFHIAQVEYEADGFVRSGFRNGPSAYRLFIH